MVFNDLTNRSGGIQLCEDKCGLGATGITGNTSLFQQFIRDVNKWNKIGANYAILAFDGHDFDDPNYTTLPSGTFQPQSSRTYIFNSNLKMLKVKVVNIKYPGADYVVSTPFDDAQRLDVAINASNVDSNFSQSKPHHDLTANGFKIYPNGASAVWVEFYRTPRDFAITGTDDWEPGFDSQFHHFPFVGAAYDYCKIYKPEVAKQLETELYGYHGRYGATVPGILTDLQDWYQRKQIGKKTMTIAKQNNK